MGYLLGACGLCAAERVKVDGVHLREQPQIRTFLNKSPGLQSVSVGQEGGKGTGLGAGHDR